MGQPVTGVTRLGFRCRTLQLRFRLGYFSICLFVLLRVFAGLIPHLLPTLQLLLRASRVYFFRLQRCLSKNGNTLRKHLDESPVDVIALLARVTAVQPHLARTKFGQERLVAKEHFHVPVTPRQLDRIGRRVDKNAFGSHQPYLQLIWHNLSVRLHLLSCFEHLINRSLQVEGLLGHAVMLTV